MKERKQFTTNTMTPIYCNRRKFVKEKNSLKALSKRNKGGSFDLKGSA